jgi:hypothetical protein
VDHLVFRPRGDVAADGRVTTLPRFNTVVNILHRRGETNGPFGSVLVVAMFAPFALDAELLYNNGM